MCCISPSHNTSIFLLCVQFILLALLVVLVTYLAVSFSEHLHHMSILDLAMYDAVDFSVSYDQIGANTPLNILALISLHTFFYNYVSLLYHSIMFLQICCDIFIKRFQCTHQMIRVISSNITNPKNFPYQYEQNRSPHMLP